MASVWRVELFGGLRAVCGDQSVTRFRSQKTATLFAYLAFYRGQSHPREELVEQLWPDADLASGRNSLSTALSSLRQSFGVPTGEAGELLITDRSSVRLNMSLVETDVSLFERLLDSAATCAPDERVRRLDRALDLYRGELLPGHYEPWIYPEQRRLSERVFQAYQQVIRECLEVGDPEKALEYAHRCVSLDPLREEAHVEVIGVYQRLGRPAQCIQQYRELERIMRSELEMSPSCQTQALVADLLAPERPEASRLLVGPLTTAAADAALAAEKCWQASGGALTTDSPLYVVRPVDTEFQQAVAERHSIVLVKGARQTGKSSLLARGLLHVRGRARIVLTDFESLSGADLETLEGLLLVLSQSITDQLGLELDPTEEWRLQRGPTLNFARFLRKVMALSDSPLVWAMDEVDRLFHRPFGDDVFALFRSWHNERALLPDTPWSRLTLAISYATEARLFIRDVNLSPFNVGTRLELGDLTIGEVEELNRRYGSPLTTASERQCLFEWLGGQPYLSQRGLASLRARGGNVGDQAVDWGRVDGVFGEHLRRIHSNLVQSPELMEAIFAMFRGEGRLPETLFYRLKSGGVLAGPSPDEARFRCKLYEVFLRRQFRA